MTSSINLAQNPCQDPYCQLSFSERNSSLNFCSWDHLNLLFLVTLSCSQYFLVSKPPQFVRTWLEEPHQYIYFIGGARITDKRTDVWSRPLCTYSGIFSPKKTGFSEKKNSSQIFFFLPFFYATFQCGRYNVFKSFFFFCPQKVEKTSLKSCS